MNICICVRTFQLAVPNLKIHAMFNYVFERLGHLVMCVTKMILQNMSANDYLSPICLFNSGLVS